MSNGLRYSRTQAFSKNLSNILLVERAMTPLDRKWWDGMVSRFKSRCPNAAGGRTGGICSGSDFNPRSIVDESIVL